MILSLNSRRACITFFDSLPSAFGIVFPGIRFESLFGFQQLLRFENLTKAVEILDTSYHCCDLLYITLMVCVFIQTIICFVSIEYVKILKKKECL